MLESMMHCVITLCMHSWVTGTDFPENQTFYMQPKMSSKPILVVYENPTNGAMVVEDYDDERTCTPGEESYHCWVEKLMSPQGVPLSQCAEHSGYVGPRHTKFDLKYKFHVDTHATAFFLLDGTCYDTCEAITVPDSWEDAELPVPGASAVAPKPVIVDRTKPFMPVVIPTKVTAAFEGFRAALEGIELQRKEVVKLKLAADKSGTTAGRAMREPIYTSYLAAKRAAQDAVSVALEGARARGIKESEYEPYTLAAKALADVEKSSLAVSAKRRIEIATAAFTKEQFALNSAIAKAAENESNLASTALPSFFEVYNSLLAAKTSEARREAQDRLRLYTRVYPDESKWYDIYKGRWDQMLKDRKDRETAKVTTGAVSQSSAAVIQTQILRADGRVSQLQSGEVIQTVMPGMMGLSASSRPAAAASATPVRVQRPPGASATPGRGGAMYGGSYAQRGSISTRVGPPPQYRRGDGLSGTQ